MAAPPYNLVTRKVLDELDDCVITLPSLGQSLTYDGINWINQTPPPTTSTIAGATDYDNTTPALDNQVITWSDSLNKFHPTTISGGSSSLATLTDVVLSSPLVDQQSLKYDLATDKWINSVSSSKNYYYFLNVNEQGASATWPISKTFLSGIQFITSAMAYNLITPHAR